MNKIICHHDADYLPDSSPGIIPVLMYGNRPQHLRSTSIGGPVLRAVRRLGVPASECAFDFLTISMAVTAADTFVDRASKAADGWTREFELDIPIANPSRWTNAVPLLEAALRFLSGDLWRINLLHDGPTPPMPQRYGRLTDLNGHDCVSLFSGGLDSAIGAIDLIAAGHRPVLVSHSYRSDDYRQIFVKRHLPANVSRFAAVANPISTLDEVNDVQMRTRSFNFIAYGALVGATMAEQYSLSSPVSLFVPENGLIALNPPLTFRRIGSLSTRTTHPFFLELIQQVFDVVRIPVRLHNPYALKTKGQMISECRDRATLLAIAKETVSCGKWKRTNTQCGKCVPCLIRRASFFASGITDETIYGLDGRDLRAVLAGESGKDDLQAMILASRRQALNQTGKWLSSTGPMPSERQQRDSLVDVANRGLLEVRSYLASMNLLI